MMGRIIEGTLTAVIVYLVLTKASEFSTAARAAGSVYADSVRALQGR